MVGIVCNKEGEEVVFGFRSKNKEYVSLTEITVDFLLNDAEHSKTYLPLF